MIDSAKITVTLFNGDTPVATSEERRVSLDIDSGSGDLQPFVLTIPEGSIQEAAIFLPRSRGPVKISAFSEGFQVFTAQIHVTGIPPLLLGLTIIGGLCGGLLAYWIRKNQKWWRLIVGVVTGVVFYWAMIFGVLPGLQRGIVLNEISAFVLTTLGGWLGTEAFDLVLKRFGLDVVRKAMAKGRRKSRAQAAGG